MSTSQTTVIPTKQTRRTRPARNYILSAKPNSRTCPALNNLDLQGIPENYWHHGRHSTDMALEIRYLDKNVKYIGGSGREGYLYDLTNVIVHNAYPRSLLEAPFANQKVNFTQVCILGGLQRATTKSRKIILYTKFIAPINIMDDKKVHAPRLANMRPLSVVGVRSTKLQRHFIKQRISGKYWTQPAFPYVTDEPKVKVMVKSRPRPHLDADQTFKYETLNKGKINARRKFEIPVGTTDIILKCWTESGSAFLRWTFVYNGRPMGQDNGFEKDYEIFTQQNTRNYMISPRRCFGEICTQSKLIFKASTTYANNGTYTCSAYKTFDDYKKHKTKNIISSMKVDFIVTGNAKCFRNAKKVEIEKCPNLINGICCQKTDTGRFYPVCFDNYKGPGCEIYYEDTQKWTDNNSCKNDAWTVAVFGSSAFIALVVAVMAIATAVFFRNKNNDTEMKAGMKDPARKLSGGRKLSGVTLKRDMSLDELNRALPIHKNSTLSVNNPSINHTNNKSLIASGTNLPISESGRSNYRYVSRSSNRVAITPETRKKFSLGSKNSSLREKFIVFILDVTYHLHGIFCVVRLHKIA